MLPFLNSLKQFSIVLLACAVLLLTGIAVAETCMTADEMDAATRAALMLTFMYHDQARLRMYLVHEFPAAVLEDLLKMDRLCLRHNKPP